MDWFNNYWGSMPLSVSKLTPQKLAKFNNNLEFQNIFQDLYLTAMGLYNWEVPDTMDPRFIERSFLLSGQCLCCEIGGAYLSLAGGGSSAVNIYGYPLKAYGYGVNGFNREFNLYVSGSDTKELRHAIDGTASSNYNAVLGYANATAYPFIRYIILAAERLSKIQRSMDVTVQNMKQPIIVSCEESQVNSVKKVLSDVDSNVSAVIGSGALPGDSLKVWNTGINPSILTELRSQYEWTENRTRMLYGINTNEQTDKRERLLVDEINANEEQTEFNAFKGLTYRQKWCDMCNEAFPGINMSVSLATDFLNEEEEEPEELEQGEEENVDG